MNTKNLYIQTIGCQMNVYDSERMATVLANDRFVTTSELHSADVIIVNTCAIREKAEQKVFSFLGRLAKLKRRKPALKIAVGGCVAQQQGEKILERLPFVDLVFGTQAVGRLSELIGKLERERCRIVDVEDAATVEPLESLQDVRNNGRVTRFVTIMQGCDNFCSYCVVPYVRGREASREPDRIVREIEALVDSGVREVTLLGQNVNSYGKKEGHCRFPELLARINAVEGLLRIRFTTSHPKDLSPELIRAFKDLDKLCKHIHLPVQSGSNPILQRMNRRYTRERYIEKVTELRKACPEIAVSSDFIVGFPGESADDFQQTLDLIRQVEYDSVFAFKYSDRPDAPAKQFRLKVSESEKDRRLKLLLALQDRISTRNHHTLVGSIQEVLVEGLSKKQSAAERPGEEVPQWTGRTSSNQIVNFEQNQPSLLNGNLSGMLVRVRIEKALPHSLWGNPVEVAPMPVFLKGENGYAS